MVFGLSLSTFTLLHVLISLIAIATGLVVVAGMLRAARLPGWTAWFLGTTVLTSATGLMFPFTTLLPSHIVAIVSLLLLAAALFALYSRHLAGAWRPVYVVTALLALYLNVFVLVIQGFMKIGELKALAPTQSEPPFVAAQGAVLVLFVVGILIATKRFRPA